jgi:hypothetical protein
VRWEERGAQQAQTHIRLRDVGACGALSFTSATLNTIGLAHPAFSGPPPPLPSHPPWPTPAALCPQCISLSHDTDPQQAINLGPGHEK